MKTTSCLISRFLVAWALLVVLLAACKKQNEGTGPAAREDFARLASASDAEADWVFDDLFNNVLGVNTEVGLGGLGVFGRVGGVDSSACFLVNIQQLNVNARFPLQITVDFAGGCPGNDGRVRKGRVHIIYTGNIGVGGNSATTSFEGYAVDNIKVEGTLTIANTSTPAKKSYTAQVQNARLTSADGRFIQWNSEKTITQTEGILTPILSLDDVFNLSGHSNGALQANGRYFRWSTAITSPLVKRFACPWIVKGVISLKRGDVETAVLDYGPGTCDNKAGFIINGTAHEITLH